MATQREAKPLFRFSYLLVFFLFISFCYQEVEGIRSRQWGRGSSSHRSRIGGQERGRAGEERDRWQTGGRSQHRSPSRIGGEERDRWQAGGRSQHRSPSRIGGEERDRWQTGPGPGCSDCRMPHRSPSRTGGEERDRWQAGGRSQHRSPSRIGGEERDRLQIGGRSHHRSLSRRAGERKRCARSPGWCSNDGEGNGVKRDIDPDIIMYGQENIAPKYVIFCILFWTTRP